VEASQNFLLENRIGIDLSNPDGDGKWSTQKILPLLAMIFGGGYERLRLDGQKVRSKQHAMQYDMDEQNDIIWWLSKSNARVSLN
jgi:hypothetical protein